MKRWAALLALAAMIAGIFTGMARAADLELAAPSSILMERATGEVLYEDNADERLRPASVTKVMTLLLVKNALADEKIARFLEKQGGSVVKTIVVKNKLVNLIVK